MVQQINLGRLRPGQAIVYHDEPYLVMEAAHHKMGRAGAVVRSKLKNFKTNSVVEVTFQGNETLRLADLQFKKSQFLYNDDSGAHFMDENYEQFTLTKAVPAGELKYLKEGQDIDIAFFAGEPIFIKLPPKVDLKVVEAPPAVKGDTANSPSKTVKLETGLEVSTPMFVKEGDIIRVNTETGEYVERV